MHNVTSTSTELTIRTQNALREFGHKAAARMQRQEGQTAAEYLGILVVVALVIAAVFGSGVASDIGTFIKDTVGSIAKGEEASN